MFKWLLPMGLLFGTMALIPFGIIAKARVSTTPKPRIHIIRDMDNQERFKAQQQNELFADMRAMRPPVPGWPARSPVSFF